VVAEKAEAFRLDVCNLGDGFQTLTQELNNLAVDPIQNPTRVGQISHLGIVAVVVRTESEEFRFPVRRRS
jgi:hypothetical protein